MDIAGARYKIKQKGQNRRQSVVVKSRELISSSGSVNRRLHICSRLAGLYGTHVLGVWLPDFLEKEQAYQEFGNANIPYNELQIL